MQTFLASATIQFEVNCRDYDGKLLDSAYRNLGYNVETYTKLVLDELRKTFEFDVSEPIIKQIE